MTKINFLNLKSGGKKWHELVGKHYRFKFTVNYGHHNSFIAKTNKKNCPFCYTWLVKPRNEVFVNQWENFW